MPSEKIRIFFPTRASSRPSAALESACACSISQPGVRPDCARARRVARPQTIARPCVSRRQPVHLRPSLLTPHDIVRPPSTKSSPRYPGWRVVLVCFVMAALVWGFGFYGHGFYLAELQRLHGWPAVADRRRHHAYYLVSALLVVFISDAIRRVGVARVRARRARSRSRARRRRCRSCAEPWQLFAAYLVMAFAWATMSLGAINNILGLWFDSKRGLAISLALNGASFGGVVIVPALVFLAGATSFATAMLAGAALILALMLPLACAILGARAPRRAVTPRRAATMAARTAATVAGPARPRCAAGAFWSVSAPFALAHHLAGGLPGAPDRLPGAGHRPLRGRHRRRHHHRHGHRRPPGARQLADRHQPAHRQPPCRSRARPPRWS